MSEDTFGTPEADFDYQYAQAERAMMDLDAMNREAILGDPLSKEEAEYALRFAFSEVPIHPLKDIDFPLRTAPPFHGSKQVVMTDTEAAIITLLNAGACPVALQDATEDIADVDFILVEDLVRDEPVENASRLALADFNLTEAQLSDLKTKTTSQFLATNPLYLQLGRNN